MTQLDSQQHRTAANLAFFNSDLFKTVQTSGLFSDSKMFADALPKQPYQEILAAYKLVCPNMSKKSLAVFIQQYFDLPKTQIAAAVDLQTDIERQIQSLWPYLKATRY